MNSGHPVERVGCKLPFFCPKVLFLESQAFFFFVFFFFLTERLKLNQNYWTNIDRKFRMVDVNTPSIGVWKVCFKEIIYVILCSYFVSKTLKYEMTVLEDLETKMFFAPNYGSGQYAFLCPLPILPFHFNVTLLIF